MRPRRARWSRCCCRRSDSTSTALDGALAANLMAGLVIDTANFQHPNTTPRTLRVAAELRAAGADLPTIARRIYRTKPNAQLRLFGRVLARLESGVDGRIVWSVLAPADFDATGATAQMSEGLIDLLAQSETARGRDPLQGPGAQTRISVRTRDGGVDATRLTGAFGGGGHARAAGATIEEPIATARPRVLAMARSRSWTSCTRTTVTPRAPTGRRSARARRRPRRRQADGTDLARRRGPRPAADRAFGGSVTAARSTRSRAGVLPVFIGRATRMVEYHLADDKALSRDGGLRSDAPRPTTSMASSRRSTARRSIARAVEAALDAVSRARSSRCRPTTRRCTSPVGARTSWRAAATSPSCGRGP